MFPEPVYAQNIIVGIVFRATFAWYVTDKWYWYLDYTKYEQALLASGHDSAAPDDYASRFHIAILNENTSEYFLSKIEDQRVPTHVLSQMMLAQRHMYEEADLLASQEYWDEILDFSPCLFVDFDHKRLYSQYPEMIRFELYVPDGWVGAYKNFQTEIPEKERYWIVGRNNLFERILEH